jgi:hypothetical protein
MTGRTLPCPARCLPAPAAALSTRAGAGDVQIAVPLTHSASGISGGRPCHVCPDPETGPVTIDHLASGAGAAILARRHPSPGLWRHDAATNIEAGEAAGPPTRRPPVMTQ